MTDVAPRHPLAQCRRQLVAEDADQDFQQRFALPSEVGDLPEIDPEVECNSQHVHQALTDFSILTIERLGRCDLDLGQNLQAHLAGCQDPDHAACAQGISAMFENAASAAPGKDRAGGQACELVGVAEQDLSLARSEEHTSELQSPMRISYAVFCLKKKKHRTNI